MNRVINIKILERKDFMLLDYEEEKGIIVKDIGKKEEIIYKINVLLKETKEKK